MEISFCNIFPTPSIKYVIRVLCPKPTARPHSIVTVLFLGLELWLHSMRLRETPLSAKRWPILKNYAFDVLDYHERKKAAGPASNVHGTDGSIPTQAGVSAQLPSLPSQGMNVRDRSENQPASVYSNTCVSGSGDVNGALFLDGGEPGTGNVVPSALILM